MSLCRGRFTLAGISKQLAKNMTQQINGLQHVFVDEVNNHFKAPETSALCFGLKHVVRTGSSRLVTHPLDNLGSAVAPLQKLYEVTQFQSNQTKPNDRRLDGRRKKEAA